MLQEKKSHSESEGPGIRKIVVLSDLHIGSPFALIPHGFVTSHGNEIRPNSVQEWLMECWEDAQTWIAEQVAGEPYVLVVNGDAIDGLHHGAVEAFSNEIEDQIEAAGFILGPVARRAEKTFFVEGTECHTNGHEHRIALAVGAEMNQETKRHIFDRLTMVCGDHTVVFKHHTGASMRSWTEASAFSSHLAEERVQASMNGHPIPDVLCMAHRHKFGHWEDAHGHAIVTPPWQCATRYARKVVPNPIVRPGVVMLDMGGKTVRVERITYKPPPPKCVRI